VSTEEILILGDDDCEPCQKLHDALKQEEGAGKVRFVGVNSEEGRALIQDADSAEIPTAFVREGTRWGKCDIFRDGDTIILSCAGKVIPLKEAEKDE